MAYLRREGGKQFSMRIYAFEFTNPVQMGELQLVSRFEAIFREVNSNEGSVRQVFSQKVIEFGSAKWSGVWNGPLVVLNVRHAFGMRDELLLH